MKKLKQINAYFKTSNLNKKILLSVLFAISITTLAIAQSGSGYGIKGGLNYNGNGDYIDSITTTKENPTNATGYHIGVFGKIGSKLYIKPELMYTKTKSQYNAGDLSMQRLDAPILVGLTVLGPVSVFAGPALQYILDSDFEDANIESIKSDFTMGLNFGIALNLTKVGIDLRYERGFSKNEATIIANNTSANVGKLDTRPEQLILSVSVKL